MWVAKPDRLRRADGQGVRLGYRLCKASLSSPRASRNSF
jgi:hypothetical protein